MFFTRLESLRGVAALGVALFHAFTVMAVDGQVVLVRSISEVHGSEAILGKLLVALTRGTSWVAVFFVLSGFVLANSLDGQRLLSVLTWLRFVVRRAFRIMPPLAVSLLVIMAFLAIRQGLHLFPRGYEWELGWKRVPSWADFWANAGLIGLQVNPPTWTIRVEMLVALGFPLQLAVCRRFGPVANVAVWVLFAIVWNALHFHLLAPLLLFAMGANAYLYGEKWLEPVPDRALPLVGLASLGLVVGPNLWFWEFGLAQTLCAGVGAAGLILLLSGRRMAYGTAWLGRGPARFLGRISYSFYLLHYIVLFATTLWIEEVVGPTFKEHSSLLFMSVGAILSVAICVPLAWAMFRSVERPSNRLGRWLTAEPTETRGVAAAAREA
jgi:peptidoglycan/LPS O-acetylase OafA/YrhL